MVWGAVIGGLAGVAGELLSDDDAPEVPEHLRYDSRRISDLAGRIHRLGGPRPYPARTVAPMSGATRQAIGLTQQAAARSNQMMANAQRAYAPFMSGGGLRLPGVSASNGQLQQVFGQAGGPLAGTSQLNSVYNRAGQATQGETLLNQVYGRAGQPLRGDTLLQNVYDSAGRPLAGTEDIQAALRGVKGPFEGDQLLRDTYGNIRLNPVAAAELQKTISGDYLGGGQFMRAYGNEIQNDLNAQFSQYGRSASGLHANTLAQGLGDAAARLYDAERNRQLTATNQLTQRELENWKLQSAIADQLSDNRLGQLELRGNLGSQLNADALAQQQLRGNLAGQLSQNELAGRQLQGDLASQLANAALGRMQLQGQTAGQISQNALGQLGIRADLAANMANNSLQAAGLRQQGAIAAANMRMQAGNAMLRMAGMNPAGELMARAGSVIDQHRQANINAARERWDFVQQRPYRNAEFVAGLTARNPGFGMPVPQGGGSQFARVIGAGLAGAQTGNAIADIFRGRPRPRPRPGSVRV